MAVEIQNAQPGEPIQHTAHHDLESFYYIILAMCILLEQPYQFKDEVFMERKVIRKWLNHEFDTKFTCADAAHHKFTTFGKADNLRSFLDGHIDVHSQEQQEDNREEASGLDMLIDDEHMEEAIGKVLQELQEDLFSFIPIAHSNINDDGENTAGPSLHQNSIVLDDNEDERMEHPTAGKVISMDETLHQRWRREFIAAGGDGEDVEMGEALDPKFFPFALETDWRVACWEIQDGIGHQSFNQLLSIPGVSDFMIFMNLAYTIARAEWKSTMISFPDTLNDTYLIQYRDILSAITTLLENPAHAKHIVYSPKKIFTNVRKESRVYHERQMGKWWHAIQVSMILYLPLTVTYKIFGIGSSTMFFHHLFRLEDEHGYRAQRTQRHSQMLAAFLNGSSVSHPIGETVELIYLNAQQTPYRAGINPEDDENT
ncbi:hypothetical protein SERLA73DRAFT_69986 [Serpula lacrymans var. lacrymans S7.3]|uniref:Fungal-type protein kinase domain-containing protein n=2 Tax=Serpula lacrymans var. lacrymans TaxID=341189 RepID=F8PLK1_SERL3|nr:uncharacterized protein SERLADRAFT_434065 [Serpula lacrymans var. lacrymans S7.9]EGO02483.1 hypothetical protein SERLA73DRAFT_69986 [Serpula lacrymans var. lacrymans S7.3]EGO28199.1 hypothetical protein SERLADRAFT_434065 [Serpula lacrymans var. lacrymans S7.9]